MPCAPQQRLPRSVEARSAGCVRSSGCRPRRGPRGAAAAQPGRLIALLYGQLSGAHSLREVRVRTDTGKVLRILSNDLEAPARDIADLHKRRRALELFFKWIEQNLKIEHFLGASENAVRIQGAVAPVAYLLLRPAKADRGTVKSPLAFAPLVRANLMRRKRIDQLIPSAGVRTHVCILCSDRGDLVWQ